MPNFMPEDRSTTPTHFTSDAVHKSSAHRFRMRGRYLYADNELCVASPCAHPVYPRVNPQANAKLCACVPNYNKLEAKGLT